MWETASTTWNRAARPACGPRRCFGGRSSGRTWREPSPITGWRSRGTCWRCLSCREPGIGIRESVADPRIPDSRLLLLIGTDHDGVREDVPLHRLLDLGLGGQLEIGQHGVEGVELVHVAVPPDRRGGPAVARGPSVLFFLAGARGGRVSCSLPGGCRA